MNLDHDAPASGSATLQTRAQTPLEVVIQAGIGAGQTVLIDPEDFAELQRHGATLPFYLVASRESVYVRCSCTDATGRQLTVARIITGAGPGEIVRYRNLDHLDLRRSNLRKSPGRAIRRDQAEALEWHQSGRKRNHA